MNSALGTAVQLYVTGPGGSGATEQLSCTESTVYGTGDWVELLTAT